MGCLGRVGGEGSVMRRRDRGSSFGALKQDCLIGDPGEGYIEGVLEMAGGLYFYLKVY